MQAISSGGGAAGDGGAGDDEGDDDYEGERPPPEARRDIRVRLEGVRGRLVCVWTSRGVMSRTPISIWATTGSSAGGPLDSARRLSTGRKRGSNP